MDHLDVAYVLGFDIITMITKLLGVSMVSRSWRIISNIHKHERGMTGLETAIILIAFVTVAAVFGYAILSAGLFSAERAKETVYAGLNEANSSM